MAVIYGLVDPSEPDHVRYVGVTMDLDARRRDYDSGKWSGRAVTAWANALAALGHKPIVIVLDVGDPCREAEMASDLKARGHKLLNTAKPGGLRRRDGRLEDLTLRIDPNLRLLLDERSRQSNVPVDDLIADAVRAKYARRVPQLAEVQWGPIDAWRDADSSKVDVASSDLVAAVGKRLIDEGHLVSEVAVVRQIVRHYVLEEGQPYAREEDVVAEAVERGLAAPYARERLRDLLQDGTHYARGGHGTIAPVWAFHQATPPVGGQEA